MVAGQRRQYRLRQVLQRQCPWTPPMITQQVRGNAKQVTPASDFTIAPWSSGCKKTEITFLHEVVSQAGTAGNPGQVSPQLPGGALVKSCEVFFIHGDARLRHRSCSRAD